MTQASITTEQILRHDQAVKAFTQNWDHADERLKQIYREMDAIRLNASDDALRVFFLIIHALEGCMVPLADKAKDRQKLTDMAEKCLNFCHIAPVRSHNSYLYTRLYMARAKYDLLVSDAWSSVAEAMVGEYLGRDSKETVEADALLRGRQAWVLGHLRTAKIALHTYDIQESNSKQERFETIRLLIRIYRLSGDIEQAMSFAFLYQNEFSQAPDLQRIVRFEAGVCMTVKTQDAKELASFMQKEHKVLEEFSLNMGRLWLFSSHYRDLWKNVSKVKAPRGKTKTSRTLQEGFVKELVDTLEGFYDQALPLQMRLRSLGARLGPLKMGADPEASLLFIAASIRWLHRIKQLTFASILMDEYHALSLSYSDGASVDVLGQMQNLRESLPVVIDRESVKQQTQLYTGSVPRFLKLSQVAVKATYLFTKLRLKNLNDEAFRVEQQAIFRQILTDFEKILSELKGPAMKIGQMLAASCSVSEDTQNILQRIYDNASGLPLAIMAEGVEAERPGFIKQSFASFDENVYAIASIGQVFRATLKDGAEVAVKIKYPDVEKIIASDLKLARVFLPIFRHFHPADRVEDLLEQYRIRFQQECDYHLEADMHSRIAELFRDTPSIKIPKIHSSLCNRHVLVSEFVHGTRLDHFIHSASLEERNHIAKVLFRFVMKSFFQFRVAHIDPHLANFIVTGSQLCVLDFGAMVAIEEEPAMIFRKLVLCMYRGDFETAYQVLCSIGIIDASVTDYPNFCSGMGLHLIAPFHEDWIQLQYTDGRGNFLEYMTRTGMTRHIKTKPNHFFVYTVIALYKDLGYRLLARLNWHQVLGEVLEECGLIEEQDKGRQKGA